MSSQDINYNKHIRDIFTNINNIKNEQNVRKKKFSTFFTRTKANINKKYKLPLNISQFKYREQSTTNLRNIISKKEKKIKIRCAEQMANGVYANLGIMNYNKEEFVLDFVFLI